MNWATDDSYIHMSTSVTICCFQIWRNDLAERNLALTIKSSLKPRTLLISQQILLFGRGQNIGETLNKVYEIQRTVLSKLFQRNITLSVGIASLLNNLDTIFMVKVAIFALEYFHNYENVCYLNIPSCLFCYQSGRTTLKFK